ncbi:MAG: N-acetylmuramoyl-L-alanine amidase [Syntrophotaleaceae bacterium]
MVFFLLLIMVPSLLVAADAEQTYTAARERYEQLLNSGRKQLYRENWEKVIQGFNDVVQRFPQHARAADGLYMAGKAYGRLYDISRRKSDAKEAVRHFERLAETYPGNPLADDALVLAGEIYENSLGEKEKAYLAYHAAAERFPDGDMSARARIRRQDLKQYASIASRIGVAAPSAASKKPVPQGPRVLNNIRYWASPTYTRVVLELDGPAEFSHGTLKGSSPRVFVDLKKTGLNGEIGTSINAKEGILQGIRLGRQPNEALRVVLDLEQLRDTKVFQLEDPHRVVIDIAAREAGLSAREPELRTLPVSSGDAIASVLEKTPLDTPPKVQIPAVAPGTSLRRIVVDPGHGGKDPGAIGPGGTMEKDVTLAIAKILAKKLREQFGCEVMLTRDKDVYLPLEERTAIANRVGADLFISVHANASLNRSVRGIETYYLNFSKNDKAAAVAARENGTSLKQVGDLEMILFDLMANSKINESSRLAAAIQKKLVGNLGRHFSRISDHGVKQGPFYVLLGATMPSVLVEAAFISNHDEEKRLKDKDFQEKAAHAIVQGVEDYARASRMIAIN